MASAASRRCLAGSPAQLLAQHCFHHLGGQQARVTSDHFGRPGISDYRNPGIAAVLKTLGFVQRFGFGIAEARRSLAANGNPDVEFRVEPAAVLAILRRAP